MSNAITIYSNGITAFTEKHKVGESGTKLSLPVKKEHISDILASLNIFGNVTLSEISFSPSNANKSSISIDNNDTLFSLLRTLSGAKVAVNGKISGTLMGVQQSEDDKGDFKVTRHHIIVETEKGIVSVNALDLESVVFTEDEINAEIKKALDAKRQSVKPNSSFIDISLVSEKGETDAVFQYTHPTAAWTINYRVNQTKNNYTLEGYAVVHNNTDKDWKDTILSVVVGEPLTFECDINEQKTPSRIRKNFVKAQAEGGIEAEVGVCFGATKGEANVRGRIASPMMACADPGVGGGGFENLSHASSAKTTTAEIGDFTIWTGQDPVNIPSQKGSLIKLFDVTLRDASSVLYYKHENHPNRPYRAIKFNNSTEWSLGYGPVSVYNNNHNEGSCTLDACKPGEKRLLIYAKETGVCVTRENVKSASSVRSVAISSGIATTETLNHCKISYNVKNSKKESFVLEMDHIYNLDEPELKVFGTEIQEKLSDGVRLKTELPSDASIDVEVLETKVISQRVTFDANWIRTYLMNIGRIPQEHLGKLQEILRIQEDLSIITKDLQQKNDEVTKLTGAQSRIRENIKVSSPGTDDHRNFSAKLRESENAIESLTNKTMPELQEKQKITTRHLNEALKGLSFVWNNNQQGRNE